MQSKSCVSLQPRDFKCTKQNTQEKAAARSQAPLAVYFMETKIARILNHQWTTFSGLLQLWSYSTSCCSIEK